MTTYVFYNTRGFRIAEVKANSFEEAEAWARKKLIFNFAYIAAE